jgi:hypothetical protein
MSTVKFKDQEYPVRFDFSAIKRTLPLFGLRFMTEVEKLEEKMAKEFPADAICPFIHNIVRSGMRYTGDEREVPTIDDIERAVDDDMTLIGRAVEAIADKQSAPAVGTEKAVKVKKKSPTSKP